MSARRIAAALTIASLFVWAVCQAAEYGDVVFKRKAEGMDDVPPAVFPHWIHRMQFKCGACHDDLFKMKAGDNEAKAPEKEVTTGLVMDLIQEGKSCGTCHNGKAAFESNFDTCSRCHFK